MARTWRGRAKGRDVLTSTLPWMLSIGWDMVGMFSLALPAAVLSLIWSAILDGSGGVVVVVVVIGIQGG